MHQIRYSTKFISYKDLKPFMADLKLVYKADTEDLALTALEDLEEKWGKKYPASIGSWRNNWTQLSTYFKYPSEIRKLIYTTNSIENFNRQLRKVTKSKTIFPTDDALFKMLYLAMMDATKKWTGKAWDWGLTLDQLSRHSARRKHHPFACKHSAAPTLNSQLSTLNSRSFPSNPFQLRLCPPRKHSFQRYHSRQPANG